MRKRNFLFLIAATAIGLVAPVTALAQEATIMPALPTPTEARFADVNGVKIWYQTYGEGKPLVLLHGGFETTESFGPNLGVLSRTRKVIGVDLQAHGGTGPLGRPMSFEAMATDVAELIKALGYDKADLMGYSMGGAVALRVAIDHPAAVDRLVLVSTAYAYSNWHTYNYEGMRALGVDPAATAKGMVGTPMYQAYVAKAPGAEASWADAVSEFASFIGREYDWSADVPNVKSPTFVIVGDWDSVRISAAAKLYQMLGGGAQDAQWDRSGMGEDHFAVIPNATHYDMFSTTAVSELAIAFLDGYPQSAAAAK